ncbi:uncharacterized protein [Triticum aestivum]|uniref:uncharacterized protein n=1 Tax=Triticum aestivum TaxID=4565 RepID=UPI001D0036D0|nr:uncharacterized protein LOC123188501 [Triticum aestivum]
MAALSARPPGNPCRRPGTNVHPMELPPPLVSGRLPVPCHIYAWTSTRGEFIISGHHINTPRDVWTEHCDNAVKENNACLCEVLPRLYAGSCEVLARLSTKF